MIFVLAPILFAVGFILNLYLGNSTELHLPAISAPIVGFSIFALLITVIFGAIFRSRTKGIIMATITIVSFFVLGENPLIGLGVIIAGVIWLFRTRRRLVTIAKFSLVTGLIIACVAGVRVFIEEQKKSESKATSPLALPKVNKASAPDIYYIVPDSYSASKNLLKYYGFDNSQFEKFLTDKEFYIASNSASNYPKTFLSLGSSLNLEYLDYLSVNKNSKNLSIVDPLIEDNNAVKFLKGQGYKYYHLGSWWGATKTNRNADFNVILENESVLPLSQFDYIVLKSTILDPVLDYILPKLTIGDSDTDRMNRANYQFDMMVEIAKEGRSPKFVFVHLIAPHEPYFFDEKCQYQPLSVRKKIKEEIKYINHLKCINSKLTKTVEGILENSKTEPIIIIQSDEGAPFLAEELDPNDAWGKASDEFLKEKFYVFNAYFVPGMDKAKLYDTITPVNTFRLIFNNYFETNFSQLPDKSYILPDLKHLYDFVDVSEKIR